nr:MAG TPA: hypothetical protein [Caudoviricetes sp.]
MSIIREEMNGYLNIRIEDILESIMICLII